MSRHQTDLFALLLGLAFAIAGALVLLTQATSVDVSPQWGSAVGLIVLGAVALAATLARAAGHALQTPIPVPVPVDVSPVPSAAAPVSSEDPAD